MLHIFNNNFESLEMCFHISTDGTPAIYATRKGINVPIKKFGLNVNPHTALITVLVRNNMLLDLDFLLKEIMTITFVRERESGRASVLHSRKATVIGRHRALSHSGLTDRQITSDSSSVFVFVF